MAVTISVYNHTARRFADGSNAPGDTYRMVLCTAATFNAADTTLAGITYTEVSNANGYATGGVALTNVAVTTVNTNGGKFDADDAVWSATGSGISATKGIIINDTDANDPPCAFVDFGETKVAAAGSDFRVIWDAAGIFTWEVV